MHHNLICNIYLRIPVTEKSDFSLSCMALSHTFALQEEGRVAQLRGFEQVQAIYLLPEPFSVENGLLTPTFKLKRPAAKAALQLQIDEM